MTSQNRSCPTSNAMSNTSRMPHCQTFPSTQDHCSTGTPTTRPSAWPTASACSSRSSPSHGICPSPTCAHRKSEFDNDKRRFEAQLRRDLANYLLTHLDRFQSYDTIKIYYDNGQQVVTNALKASIGYALSKEAVIYRKADPKDYRLEQAADLMCAIELTALKFKAGENTETDHKMFGDWRSFKQNYLKALRRKQAK